jgi:hypothetical protein
MIELIDEANMRRSAVMGASATCDPAIVDLDREPTSVDLEPPLDLGAVPAEAEA